MVIIVMLAAAVILYLLFILPTQWLKVEMVRYPLGLQLRIMQISDLHVDMLRIGPQRISEAIAAHQPDYIFLTGDYTYKASYLPRLAEYLKAITQSGIPVYAVLGNHDYEFPRLRRLLHLFQAYHIPVLRNSSISLPNFQLVGIDDFCTGHSHVSKAFSKVDRQKPILVMTHDPNVVLRMKQPYHYLMAGHLHGKQLNIPYFFRLKPKGPLSVQGIYKGLHKGELGPFYISKGIGQAGVNARFMVRSEITIHDL